VSDGPPQLGVELLERAYRLTPVLLGRLRHSRPALSRRQLPAVPAKPPQHQAVVAAQVQDQLPDAVCARDRMRCGLMRRDTVEHLEHGGAVPRIPLECSPKLLFEPTHFCLHTAPFPERPNAKLTGGSRGEWRRSTTNLSSRGRSAVAFGSAFYRLRDSYC